MSNLKKIISFKNDSELISLVTFAEYDNAYENPMICNPEYDCIEIWESLECFDIKKDKYEISTFGNIRNKKTIKLMNNNVVTIKNKQYRLTGLATNTVGEGKTFRVHRLVAKTFCAPGRDDQDMVNHIDSDGTYNHFRNLEWCTGTENMQHASKYGNLNKGEDNSASIFTNVQVHRICELLEIGYSYRDILFDIKIEYSENHCSAIGNIRRKIIWTHISDLYNIPKKIDTSPLYDDDIIHKICKLLESGVSSKDIAIAMFGCDINDTKTLSKHYKFLYKIKNRSRYANISKDYNF